RLADHRQVFLLDEADGLLAAQLQLAAGTDGLQARLDGRGVDAVRLFAFETEQHRLVAAVALAGGAEGTVQLDTDACRGAEQALAAQAVDEARGGTHRPHRVRAGRTDADLEQVENAEGHGVLR